MLNNYKLTCVYSGRFGNKKAQTLIVDRDNRSVGRLAVITPRATLAHFFGEWGHFVVVRGRFMNCDLLPTENLILQKIV
ncbi:hypothetical protein [Brunnivagina elsteri]|uniref:Uncharacterized protein n=1 Tax=Brunnivagina elsteri CCALA 953 TaxID=987040 RepID=A0A2A2TG60_9CYAN|nr:hypothetical protein [Calothrix elsteri]PAX52628.1 hypothetical protein CK510_18265 [Calothrix elsteri CCALA 953]